MYLLALTTFLFLYEVAVALIIFPSISRVNGSNLGRFVTVSYHTLI